MIVAQSMELIINLKKKINHGVCRLKGFLPSRYPGLFSSLQNKLFAATQFFTRNNLEIALKIHQSKHKAFISVLSVCLVGVSLCHG